MATQWSKRALILIVTLCAFGGFLAGSSRSQAPAAAPKGEIGRYQMVVAQGMYVVFDTATAEFWFKSETELYTEKGQPRSKWDKYPSPAK